MASVVGLRSGSDGRRPVMNVGYPLDSSPSFVLGGCPLWAGQRPWRATLTGGGGSALGPFSHLQRVIHLDAKVSYGALQLAVTKQELYGPQVLRTTVD